MQPSHSGPKNFLDEDFDIDEFSNNPSPIIWVHEFDEVNAKRFIEQIHKLEQSGQVSTILIYIDSNGGCAHALFTMLAAIDESKKDIYTVCVGKAFSCGAILFSAGKKRFISKYGTIMIHEVSAYMEGSTSILANETSELKRINELAFSILAKNCKKKKQVLLNQIKHHNGDLWLGPDDAIKFGICDHIGTPKLKRQVSWELDL